MGWDFLYKKLALLVSNNLTSLLASCLFHYLQYLNFVNSLTFESLLVSLV